MRGALSLKARALQLLALREQSRLELRRKLLRHPARPEAGDTGDDDGGERRAAEVDALLDWLEANRFLSAERFVESRIHARQGRFGNRRIRAELAQHGVALPVELKRALDESELGRAAAVRERRFAEPPGDAAQAAAQARFLAARGFSAEVVHRLMRALKAASRGGSQQ